MTGIEDFLDDFWRMTEAHPFSRKTRLYDGVMIELSPWAGTIRVSSIQTTEPRKGAGTAALRFLIGLADQHRVKLTGTAKAYSEDPLHITETDRLVEWYRKHGFSILSESGEDGYEIEYQGKED